jgi:hypothetical protein
MDSVWVAGWRAFTSTLPHVFRGTRRRTFFLAMALGLATGAALSAALYWALGPRLGDGVPYLAILVCVGGVTAASVICATVFYVRDRTSQWWIAGTHETTMKRVLAAVQTDSLDTVSEQDLHDARRSAEILNLSGAAAILGPLIGAVGLSIMLVVAVAMGSTLTLLGAFFIFIAQVATAASGLLTLGRARLVTSAIEEHRPAAQ